jgi:hypothetical protein
MRLSSPLWCSGVQKVPAKSGFYETVTDVNSGLRFFFVWEFFLFRLRRMLFSTVFLFALYVSRPGSVPVGVQ